MLKPVNKTIFVRPDEPLLKRGALFMPPSDTKQSHGIVLAVSPDVTFCKVGDRIAYTRFFPTTIAGVDLVTVDDKSVFAVDDSPDPVNADQAAQGVSRQAPTGTTIDIATPAAIRRAGIEVLQ